MQRLTHKTKHRQVAFCSRNMLFSRDAFSERAAFWPNCLRGLLAKPCRPGRSTYSGPVLYALPHEIAWRISEVAYETEFEAQIFHEKHASGILRFREQFLRFRVQFLRFRVPFLRFRVEFLRFRAPSLDMEGVSTERKPVGNWRKTRCRGPSGKHCV